MSLFKKTNPIAGANDAALVMYALAGDRDAFCEIVSRYQNLLCSLAYSSVGDIKHSEDIAQEAFVEAWKKLDTLRDPEKLKSWLCAILRFKVSHYRRKEATQAVKNAEELAEQHADMHDSEQMDDAAIAQQHQTLMWNALQNMDDIYREPLILFYREQQSVERVAAELDLSQDTVKQRLSRGRKLLKSAMSSFVEDALAKSKPGVAFTAAVFVAINGIAPPAKAAVFGAGAAKTSSLFNLATVLTLLAALSGFISSYFGLRASFDQSRTQKERRLAVKTVALFMSLALLYVVGMLGLKQLALQNTGTAGVYAFVSQLLVLAFVSSYLFLVSRMFTAIRTLRAQERRACPQAFTHEVDQVGARQREYKSRWQLFGVPLIHFQFAMPEVTDKPAFGWIAGGSYARGLLFAWGGVAIAPVSVGIVSVGVITVGAVGFGLISTGTVAVGIIAFGASAIAYNAYASLSSLGWESAFSNGFSMASEAAIGPIAYAAQINNDKAAEIVNLTLLGHSYQWVLAAIAILVIVPAAWHARKVRQRMKPSA